MVLICHFFTFLQYKSEPAGAMDPTVAPVPPQVPVVEEEIKQSIGGRSFSGKNTQRNMHRNCTAQTEKNRTYMITSLICELRKLLSVKPKIMWNCHGAVSLWNIDYVYMEPNITVVS